MAALAYLLLPFTGLLAFTLGRDARVRSHGLQAIGLGVVWPATLLLASAVSASLTRIVFVAGAATWLVLLIATALGRDPLLPVVARGAVADD